MEISSIEDPNDRVFMERLYEDFKGLMLYTAQKYLPDSGDQEDAVHDAVLKLMKKISELRGKERCVLTSYIVFTVRSTSIDLLRRQGRDRFVPLEDAELPAQPQEALMELAERRGLLAAVWPKLHEADQMLLAGKYILGYRDGELAELLGCEKASVRMKLTRARRRALQLLREWEG